MLGLDDLEQGQVFAIGEWQLTVDAVKELAATWDPQPFHLDAAAAKKIGLPGITASSLHIFAICTRLWADFDPGFKTLAMMGKEELRLHRPALATDLLRYSTEVVRVRPSRSRLDRGVVRLGDTVVNAQGDVVMTQFVDLMLAR